MRQEGYSKSGRNIIRNGHISGREAITSGEASPTGRHKKRPVRVFLPYRGNAVHRITHPASRGVLHICGTSWNQAEIPHSEGSFPIANEAAFPHHLEDPGASRGLTPPHGSLHPRGNECRSDGQRQNAHRRYRSDRPRCGHRRSWLSGGRWQGRGPCPSSCCHRVSRNG